PAMREVQALKTAHAGYEDFSLFFLVIVISANNLNLMPVFRSQTKSPASICAHLLRDRIHPSSDSPGNYAYINIIPTRILETILRSCRIPSPASSHGILPRGQRGAKRGLHITEGVFLSG
ncbi:MAG: hypothetical protein WCX63_05015, partial [Methanoregula sp.]